MAKKKKETLDSFEEKPEVLVVEEIVDDIVLDTNDVVSKIYQIKTIERWKLNNVIDLVSQGRNEEAAKVLRLIQTIDRALLNTIISLLEK